MTRIAIAQTTTGIDPVANAEHLANAVRHAAGGGAAMLFTPEMSGLLDRDRSRAGAKIVAEGNNPVLARMQAEAKATGLWIALGSLAIKRADGRWANRAFVIDPDGCIAARYDKIHMFDVALGDGDDWRESNAYEAGETCVVVPETPVGRLGLSICYDIRFPALYDALGRADCDIIAIPAAFTVPTGRAHWHILQRARAIEASAFVVAAAQVGEHPDGRTNFGHSLVVDPWGDIMLDMGGEAPGIGFAEVDLSRIAEVRRKLPSIANRRAIGGAGFVIVFDLSCGGGHLFEGWFASSNDFADQCRRGLVSCPQCGSSEVCKAPMAPAVPRKGSAVSHTGGEPSVQGGTMPAELLKAFEKLAKAQAKALKTSEYVGDRFAEESRAIHYGEREGKPIHGKATLKDARDLLDEGIAVAPIVAPFVPPDDLN